VSSILDALRELEPQQPVDPRATAWIDRRRRRRHSAALAAGMLGAVAIGACLWLLVPAGRHPSDAVPAAVADRLPLAPPAPAPPADRGDRPQARLKPAGSLALAVATPGETTSAEEPAAEAPATEPSAAEPSAPAGGAGAPIPRVRLSSLLYAEAPAQRRVTLSIDGGPAVTLHEGESSAGVEIALIQPDRVYVRHRGTIFSVRGGR
jgi:hypothetical protein